MSDELVTVRRVSLPIDAHLLVVQLEAEGVEAVVLDAESASINPLLLDAMGGVRVQVRARDLPRAIEILDRPLEIEDELGEMSTRGRCPRCNSEYTAIDWTPLEKAASALLLFAPLVVLPKSSCCRQCQHVWKEGQEVPVPRKTPYRRLATKFLSERPVFRLRRDGAVMGMLSGAILSTALAVAAGDGRWVVLAAAGWMFGRARTTDFCSEPSCRTVLPDGVHRCPRCAGSVEGVIHAASDHFAAKAEWRRKQRASSPSDADPPA